MSAINRRDFISRASAMGLAPLADSWWNGAQDKQPAGGAEGPSVSRVFIDPAFRVAPLDRNLFGSFIEHLGRAVYEGIYEPGSPLADSDGFRKDVMEVIRQAGVPIIRYPGGNFVSGYDWLNGVGPKKDRPTVLDRAWDTIETNQFGTDEFLLWCKKVGTEPLLGLNLGSGNPAHASELVEYCNLEKGTKFSDLRRQYGHAEPYNVKHWCLGNEMDGPWQIGHCTAQEYGLRAADAARQMRAVDPSLFLVACGSSGPFMPTYLEWDRQMLEECYPVVDAISLHRYYNNTSETGGDTRHFVALNLTMERQIEEIQAVCDMVRGRMKSNKTLYLSFDEWNVWYRERDGDGHKQKAPHILEEVYNLEDALLVGGLINSLLRHADRVRIACLAQLINALAALLTNEQGVLKQTIFYPYSWALQNCSGDVLRVEAEFPTYEVERLGQVPYLDVVATRDTQSGKICLLVLNRDLERSREFEVNWRAEAPTRVLTSQVITGPDLKATNTFTEPNKVVPAKLDPPQLKGERTVIEVPAKSYSLFVFATA
jgi:alpha-L-arabinofuranosidase